MSTELELRILSGVHAHARCPARDGASIGSDPACDVVLADAGMAARAARLVLADSGWRLSPAGAETPEGGDAPLAAWTGQGSDLANTLNSPAQLGPVWLTVAPASDPWPAVPLPEAPIDEVPAAGASPSATVTAPLAQSKADVPNETPAADFPPGAASAGVAALPAAMSARTRTVWPAIAGAVGLALFVLVLMALLAPPSTPAPKPSEASSPALSLGQINAVLERLGLSSRLHVGMTPNGAARVTGWVRNAAERDALASALSQIWPMPAMRVSIEDEAVQTAHDVLAGFSMRFLPRYDGDGRMTLLGVAASARERASALDAVRAQLPGMTIMGHQIALAADVADALAARLSDSGLSGVTLSWRDKRLEATPPLDFDDEGMARLTELLASFNADHADVAALARELAERPVADRVPFVIRSVVGGPQPFIVLADGSKLLVGGVHAQYRLTAIESDRLVFEGPRPAVVLR